MTQTDTTDEPVSDDPAASADVLPDVAPVELDRPIVVAANRLPVMRTEDGLGCQPRRTRSRPAPPAARVDRRHVGRLDRCNTDDAR